MLKNFYPSKKTLKSILAVILVIGFLFPFFQSPKVSACSQPEISHYDVVFNGRTLDNQNNTSTWSYTVYKIGCGPDLSHWIWQPCFPLEELLIRFVAATPEASEVGPEGSTGHYGVKWEIDGAVWDSSGITFTVTITGQPDIDEDGAIAVIKAGQAGDHDHGNQPHFDLTIPGPSCEPSQPYCGDSILDSGEECDEGVENGIECTPEYGSFCNYCSTECTIVELQGPYCGNGNVDQPYEECEIDEDCTCGRICVDCMCKEKPVEPVCGNGILEGDEECDDGNKEDGDGCSANCEIEEEITTIKAYKVVCETEEDLPNWATSGIQPSEPSMITETTAQDYVDSSGGKCWLEENWDFQWGFDGEAQKQVGDHIGPAPDGTGWHYFDSSTATSTPAIVQISELNDITKIWVRENLKAGYIPFTYPPLGPQDDDVSAEMLCHTDILNYDNYDYIINPELAQTYYCVAFNTQIEEPGPYCGDGNLDQGEDCDDGINNGQECTPEYGSSCTYCSLDCEIVELFGPYCGDQFINGEEECEIDEDCSEGEFCNSCMCEEIPEVPECGNGILENGEECDNGEQNGEACTPACNSSCSYCSSECTLVTLQGGSCGGGGNGGYTPRCGNGILDFGEECDGTAGLLEGYTCTADCTLEKIPCNMDLDIIMVMDVSGSMGYEIPTRLSQAKIAANDFLSNLRNEDQSGLVSFSWTATLDKSLSNQHAITQSIINDLTANGATNISQAIDQANLELISTNANPEALKVQILLTDGRANRPNGDGSIENPNDVALTIAKSLEAAENEIIIFTIGLGASINTEMLQTIANNTGGKYYFAPATSDLDGIFNQIAHETCNYEFGLPALTVYNQRIESISENSVIVSWYTNIPGTSRVVYDTQPVESLGSLPNYGYAYSTPETDITDKVIFHLVTIDNLIPNTTYYLRGISHASPEEVLSEELIFTTPPLSSETTPEEEIIEEIGKEVEEEKPEEKISEEESKTGFERFLAAIGSFLNSRNLCWFLFFIIIILIILFLLSIQKRGQEEKEKKRRWVLLLAAIILIILYCCLCCSDCFFCCFNCWFLIIITAISAILFFLLRKIRNKYRTG